MPQARGNAPDGKQMASTHPDGKDLAIDVIPEAGGLVMVSSSGILSRQVLRNLSLMSQP